MIDNLVIVSRKSPLAMWQAEFVKAQLQSLYPNLQVSILGVTTTGDKIVDKSLSKIGGKGLFVKELEAALLEKRAHLAVHSLKDMQAILSPEFSIGAILKRGEVEDVLVSNAYSSLENMPSGSVIGTSSSRRSAILNKHYPHLTVVPLRGNVQTRIAKLDDVENNIPKFEGIILAKAGLIRLGLGSRITQVLDPSKFIPAVGQGALAIEILSSNVKLRKLLEPLNDQDTIMAVKTERQIGANLDAGCSTPLGVHAKVIDTKLCIKAMLATEDYQGFAFSSIEGEKEEYLNLAFKVSSELRANLALK